MWSAHSTETERGSSEVLGFVFVFAAVVLAIGFVSVAGVGMLEGYDETARERAASEDLLGISDSIGDLIDALGVTRRNHELAVRDGRLFVEEDGPRVTITVADGTETRTETWETGAIGYEGETKRLSYEGGAVFRHGEDGRAAVLGSPRFRCTDTEVLVSLPVIRAGSEPIQPGGSGTVRTEAAGDRYRNEYTAADAVEVELEFDDAETANSSADGWENALEPEWERLEVGTDERLENGTSERTWRCGGDESDQRVSVQAVGVDVDL